MAKNNQKLVKAITSQEENFVQWYTDICLKAELVEYSSVKGFIILRPYGQAIWENIQRIMDGEFKKTGHENVAMPVLIPESLLKKEGELVAGFAPEVAWVTAGGSEPLEERLAVRPTSETMFCDHWSRVLQSYRELPMKYNQWCSVIRWEKTTRPFLRSREFWWQEGHTIHETAEEAMHETEQQLNCYADFCEQNLCIPVLKGRKTEKEKFAGADATYTIEAMMKDGKALQSGTSHYFGDKFSIAYDVTFQGRDNQLHHPHQTSWGVSTRLIGAIIMTHGDDDGLILPPAIAPHQVVVVPIASHKEGVLDKAREVSDKISAFARVKLDDSDNAPGWKFSQWEMKGVPLRLEIGPKDIEKNQCVLVRRDTREKIFCSLDELEAKIPEVLKALADDLFAKALANREARTYSAASFEEVQSLAKEHTGYIKAMWCGDLECEMKMKNEAGLSSRCMPFAQETLSDVCPCCGKPAKTMVYWGVAY
ncbi:MAG: proline--tRNA ligase [Faecalibacterium sp.]